MDLKTVLTSICDRWKYKLDETSPGVFRLDVAMKQTDGSTRCQFVYAWLIKERYMGKDAFYFNSRCCVYTPNINLYHHLGECIQLLNPLGVCEINEAPIGPIIRNSKTLFPLFYLPKKRKNCKRND